MAALTSESLAAVQSEVAAELSAADLSVAEELFGAVDVLDSSAALRRGLTDPSRQAADREALVTRLFGGTAQQVSLRVLTAIAARRWSRERDLADAVETLAVTAVAADAERDGLQGLEELEGVLLGFRRTVADSHEVQRALTDPQAQPQAKRTLAQRLSPDASDGARLLIDRAVTVPRGLRPSAAVELYAQRVAARQRHWIAQVTVARELDASQRDKLARSLDSYFGRELRLDVVVEPAVVGGIRVQVGDEVVDSTMATKLSTLNRRLAG